MKLVIQQVEVGFRTMREPWQLVMGDDDFYTNDKNLTTATLMECVKFGHEGQEEASSGVLHIKLDHETALSLAFTVE